VQISCLFTHVVGESGLHQVKEFTQKKPKPFFMWTSPFFFVTLAVGIGVTGLVLALLQLLGKGAVLARTPVTDEFRTPVAPPGAP
jgi:hypothetical protein